jgi:hypothetical protein
MIGDTIIAICTIIVLIALSLTLMYLAYVIIKSKEWVALLLFSFIIFLMAGITLSALGI